MKHTNVLDSRSLGLGDAYGQRFMKAGTYTYAVGRPGVEGLASKRPHRIVVAEADGDRKMAQTTVMVSSEGRGLTVDQPVVEIVAGDLVMWAPADADVPRFAISGEKEFFGSSRMVNECGYSHAFGLPGDVAWRDAHGGRVGGRIRVRQPKIADEAELKEWRERISRAQLVMIDGEKVEPAKVEIEVGQTVYFAVVKGEGISITDDRLLER